MAIAIVTCLLQVALFRQYLRINYPTESYSNEYWSDLAAALFQESRYVNDFLTLTTNPPSPNRFHELLENFTKKQASQTADEPQIIQNQTLFFHPIRLCGSTCCAETVAISLDHDDHHIKNTLDGTNMADTFLQNDSNDARIRFFGSILHPDLPCLQPGTIMHIDNHVYLLKYFFKILRPNITVPYVLITSRSDANSPLWGFKNELSNDNLMLKWFGTNPTTIGLTYGEKEKFHAMPLGLPRHNEQNRIMTEYLTLINYANPFRNKERWTKSLLMNMTPPTVDRDSRQMDLHDEGFYKSIFINYRFHYAPSIRFISWERLCHGINSTLYDGVTCEKQTIPPRKSSTYLFAFSPPGAGIDCYRTYETLLLGVIPIVPDAPENWGGLFDDLPVLVLKDFNKNRTRAEYIEIMRDYIASPRFQDHDFESGWKKLFLRYWRRLVLETAGRKVIMDPDTGKEYYEAWEYTSTTQAPPAGPDVPQWFTG
jgi:hypothetical protein